MYQQVHEQVGQARQGEGQAYQGTPRAGAGPGTGEPLSSALSHCPGTCAPHDLWYSSAAAALQVLSADIVPAGISVMVGSVTHGAFRRGPCHVVHSGMGCAKLAEVDPQLPHLMHAGHQRVWDEWARRRQQPSSGEGSSERRGVEDGGAEAVVRNPSREDGMEQPGVLGTGQGYDRGSSQGCGSGEADLLQLLLDTPGLAAELVPSHTALMQQVRGYTCRCTMHASDQPAHSCPSAVSL